jgi:gluconolactonase
MLFRFLIIISTLANTYAWNKLISLPLSITSNFESTSFHRYQNQSFSYVNFPGITDIKNLKPDQRDLLLSRNASFISYSTEFLSIINYNSELKLIEQRPITIPFAHEGGTYIPETNEVWFTADQLPIQNTNISSVNLLTNQVDLLDIYPPIITPNGLIYFEGYVYVCSQGTKTIPAAIYAVNPTTRISKIIVNSWFGYRLNSPNDITFSTKISGKTFMWFTDPQIAFIQGFSGVPQYQSTVFRYDMSTSELRPVITDLVTPTGIAFNHKETRLYVSDTAPEINVNILYVYDINEDGLPIDRRIFSISSFGSPDGIKVDKNGRVWAAEGDGINVRDRHGTLLGVILGHDLNANGIIRNFALMENTVIILAQESLWRLNLMTDVL